MFLGILREIVRFSYGLLDGKLRVNRIASLLGTTTMASESVAQTRHFWSFEEHVKLEHSIRHV